MSRQPVLPRYSACAPSLSPSSETPPPVSETAAMYAASRFELTASAAAPRPRPETRASMRSVKTARFMWFSSAGLSPPLC